MTLNKGIAPTNYCRSDSEVPSGIEPLYLVLQTSA